MSAVPGPPSLGERGCVLQFATMVPPAAFGGAERVVAWLAEQLTSAGWQVHNAGLTSRRSARDGDGGHPIPNLYWPFDGRRRGVLQRTTWHAVDTLTLAARSRVEALVEATQPSVIVTHNLRGWGYAPWVVAGERGIPLVHLVHDYGLICNSSTLWRGRVCEEICRPCTPRRNSVDRRWPGGLVVGVSRAVLTEHERHGVRFVGGAVVVHPSEAATVVAPTGSGPRRLDGTPETVGYLGRVDDAKGLDVLLTAVDGTGQRLLVAGDGDPAHVQGLRDRSAAAVEWLGWTQPSVLFDRIDVLVVPSVWREPFGLVVVEAARAGVPVLIADQSGLMEAARASGARFATFRTGDVADLQTALARSTAGYTRQPSDEEPVDLVELINRLPGDGRGRPPG